MTKKANTRKIDPPSMATNPLVPPPGWQAKARAARPAPTAEADDGEKLRAILETFSHLKPVSPEAVRAHEWANGVFGRVEASRIPKGPGGAYWREIGADGWKCPDAPMVGDKRGLNQRDVYGVCRRKCTGRGAILALIGERGTGKTMIAAQLIIAEAWEGRVAPYRKLTGIVSDFKALYADFGSTEIERTTALRDRLCQRRLVIIDEVHEATADSRHAMKILADILDRRYSNNVDTILISNQKMKEFQDSMSDSILSRIMERGRIIPCVWPSWRQRIAEGAA